MKVGEILKEEIQDTPGLQYPYKIKINKNYIYPYRQKLENSIFLENCNNFLNDIHKNKKSLLKHRSYSHKKNLKLQAPNIKLFLKKNSQNYSKNPKMNLFNENLPLLVEPVAKTERKLSVSNAKLYTPSINRNSLFKNKLNKLKNLNIEINNNSNYSLSNRKKNIIRNIKESQSNNHIRGENLFKTHLKNKKKNNNDILYTQNIFQYRLKKKMKTMNNIINKLNTPIFIYNKTETN